MLNKALKLSLTVIGICTLCCRFAYAGPPYLTDDPEPVPYHHWEFYTFITQDKMQGSKTTNVPAFELNNGVAPNTQMHLVIPFTLIEQNGMNASGIGDSEIGMKYRLLGETKKRPEIGVFPMAELPTGSHANGYGNGRAWYKVPVWLQKSWGAWTSYGGGGYAFNSQQGQRNFAYGGLLIQRTLSKSLTLGGEIFLQGAQAKSDQTGASVPGSRESSFWNLGGSYNFTPDFSLLFTTGHSFHGEGHAILYIGLYRTWGPGAS